MPIRADQRSRYPKDWPEISKRIRERAGGKCEQCGVPNRMLISRSIDRDKFMDMDGNVHDATTGEHLGTCRGSEWDGLPVIMIVLTVSHRDHTPENCADENLWALCQRCHLLYDRDHHRQTARANWVRRWAMGDLFDQPQPQRAA